MIHIVFNSADVAVLKKAMELEPSMAGEVKEIKDDYAVGPITDLFTPEGRAARNEWWTNVLLGGDYEGHVEKGIVNDEAVVAELVTAMDANPEEVLWIWAAQNKHDVSGYYWLVSQLKAYASRVFILYLNNLPFISDKGTIFYPEWLHVIPPKEFLKARKLARPITLSEFEVDPDEWKRLAGEQKLVRILEGGKKLGQHGEDFYDADLKRYASVEWQKASRVISQFLSKNKHTTGDAFLLWRLKTLIGQQELEARGELKGMKDFDVKIPGGDAPSTEETTTE